MESPGASRALRTVALGGAALLAAWVAWWLVALVRLELPGFAATWIPSPAFGADFWTQPEYAARSWFHHVDPYANERHLFHYPPLVIRLFLWVNYVPPAAALRSWIVANALVVVVGTLAALRVREALGLPRVPRALAVALVLWSFPVVFELERANFDLISLAVVLAAAPLIRRGGRSRDLCAGALLAVGPWVKLYPGVLGLLLVGLRRPWAVAGFTAAGIAIGAATPRETLRSFEVLRIAVHRVHDSTLRLPLSTWTHSVTAALTKLAQEVPEGGLRTQLLALPLGALAVALVVASVAPLTLRVFRHPAPARL